MKTIKEKAREWGITGEGVNYFLLQGMVPGAYQETSGRRQWWIPDDAKKPLRRFEMVKAGDRFGLLEAVEHVRTTKYGAHYWKFRCDCGKTVTTQLERLFVGETVSCGCWRRSIFVKRNTKHGDSSRAGRSRLYGIWGGMRSRCECKSTGEYEDYGGRGIRVCEEWDDYSAFKMWAIAAGYVDGGRLQIDRINNDGNYEPSNCRFVTSSINNRNKRTNRFVNVNGERKCVSDWAKTIGRAPGTVGRWLLLYGEAEARKRILEVMEDKGA